MMGIEVVEHPGPYFRVATHCCCLIDAEVCEVSLCGVHVRKFAEGSEFWEGAAISICWTESDERMFVGGGCGGSEYGSQVNFCPFCGSPAGIKVEQLYKAQPKHGGAAEAFDGPPAPDPDGPGKGDDPPPPPDDPHGGDH